MSEKSYDSLVHLKVLQESQRQTALSYLYDTLFTPQPQHIHAQTTASTLHSQHISALCQRVAELTPGFYAGDLKNLCLHTAVIYSMEKDTQRQTSSNSHVHPVVEAAFDGPTLNHFVQALRSVKPSSSSSLKSTVNSGGSSSASSTWTWDSIGGLFEIKKRLQLVIKQWTNAQTVQRLGLNPIAGVLFHGPSGNGKTLISRIMASQAGLNCIFLR